jgi:hypothetical protein
MACYVRLRSPKSITVSGLFMRPHRARLSDKKLCQLMFLKCNRQAQPEDVAQCKFTNSNCSEIKKFSVIKMTTVVLHVHLYIGPIHYVRLWVNLGPWHSSFLY